VRDTGYTPRAWAFALAAAALGCVGAAALGDSQDGTSDPCLAEFDRSCAGIKANTTRTCTNGSQLQFCEDIIVTDGMVKDIKLAASGESGGRGIPCAACGPTALITIDVYRCSEPPSSGTCEHVGVRDFTCDSRRKGTIACTGQ
jgi:hypothetical protein